MSYKGKSAIVTGGASGIGRGLVEHLLKNGCDVVIADVNPSGEAVAKEVAAAAEARCLFQKCDVTIWEEVVAVFALTKKELGRVDFVFANSGIAQMNQMRANNPAHFATAVIDDLDSLASQKPNLKVIEVNLTGVMYTCYAALAYFRAQELDKDGFRGKLVLTGSNASFYPFPNDVLYSAAKHGVAGIAKSLGPRVGAEGITVNAFGPNVVATALAPQDWLKRLIADGRITPMSTVTAGADLFISPKSRINGHIIENVGGRNVFQPIPQFADPLSRKNMDEFWPVDEQEAILSLEGYDVEIAKA